MERKKNGKAAVLMVFLHCWCSADDGLGRLVVFGREGAGKRCRFEGRRRCWNRLEREKENEGLCREGSPAGLAVCGGAGSGQKTRGKGGKEK